MGALRDAILDESVKTKTKNGADAYCSTKSACVDMLGRAGSLQGADPRKIDSLISCAWAENPLYALRLMFYTRDIKQGYGQRSTFATMLKWLANVAPETVEKNLWAILEFGYAKDLYALIGTKAENAMWTFMAEQFNLDLDRMAKNKSVSLLAKWIATPTASSEKTKELGKLTAKKLGYTYKNMSEYKKKLTALRTYIDIPEAKMSTGRWSEIEYSKCASRFILTKRNAILKNDGERFEAYLDSVNKGEKKINTGAVYPCDILHAARSYDTTAETMWKNLKDFCTGNAMVMCDTSGSMEDYGYYGGRFDRTKLPRVAPIDVAASLAIYFAERNKGDLKDLMMNFSDRPTFITLNQSTLKDKYDHLMRSPVNYSSTNLEKAFDLLLNKCVECHVPQEDMPDTIIVISDMQINCVEGICNNKLSFYGNMKSRYNNAGYKMPQVVFWNVNASEATFLASASENGVSLVSGYSPAIMKSVMEVIGSTPYDLMLHIVEDERYSKIVL